MEPEALTSTTAPGKYFSTRKELAEHYKSDWHRYNLKRREAGLPLVVESDFLARLEAAAALRKQNEHLRNGTDHLKNKNGKKNKKKNNNKQQQSNNGANSVTMKSQAQAYDTIKQQQQPETQEEKVQEQDQQPLTLQKDSAAVADTANIVTDVSGDENEEEEEEDEDIIIEPKQSLFDSKISDTLEDNVKYMYTKYGFFIPDREYLFDLEGLIGYCHEKIKLGHMCLYCQSVFTTWQGCQKHMISKEHTKLRYEHNIDLDEMSVFYDFKEADEQFLNVIKSKHRATKENTDTAQEDQKVNDDNDDGDGDDEDDWEDISDDDGEHKVDDEADSGLYDGFEEQISKLGFDITPLGELVFPNGKIIGHRTLSRYYKQRIMPSTQNAAVTAARHAAGERLYKGRVYNMNDAITTATTNMNHDSLILAKAGISPNKSGNAGSGKGVLVKSDNGLYTSISVFRYRAVITKQKREETRARRSLLKLTMNKNKMDKKHNSLQTGVVTAKAPR